MTENEKKSKLYFIYLRYFNDDKPKHISEFTEEELKIEIEKLKIENSRK